MNTLFEEKTDEELKIIYEEILKAKEEGLRPRILDYYIQKVCDIYPLTFGEGWKYTEKLFYEEVARRFFVE